MRFWFDTRETFQRPQTLLNFFFLAHFTGFNEYFRSLKPQTSTNQCQLPRTDFTQSRVNCRNLWFNEFWSQRHKCRWSDNNGRNATSLPRCTGNEDLSLNYEQEGLVPFVIDAVYSFAKALDDIIKDKCGTDYIDHKQRVDCVQKLLPIAGPELLRALHNVSFIGPQGTEIRFNEDGDAYGYYNIYQYQNNDTKYDYVPIGTWRER